MNSPDSSHAVPVPALILAGGLGTRLKPLTDTVPKCLVPILGVPLLEYWMRELARIGSRRVTVNTHHLPEPVRAYLVDVSARLNLDAREFYEPKLLGSAGTVAANPDLCEGADCCLLIYADNLSSVRLDELVAFHRGHGAPMTMMLFHTSQPKACGIASMDSEATIVEFVEKPLLPKSNLANGGIYVISREAYREIVEMRSFDFGFDVLPRFIGRMKGKVHSGLHMDIGNLDALKQAEVVAKEHFGLPPSSSVASSDPSGDSR